MHTRDNALEHVGSKGVKAVRRKFFEYALPSIVAMWVFSFYSMVDGFFVSWGAGPMALAAVNISLPYVSMIFGLSILCSAGASAVISIYLGKGDRESAMEAFLTNLVSLVVISGVITAVSLYFIDDLTTLLGATPNLAHDVKTYVWIISLFVVFFVVTYFFEVMARADGFPKLATISVSVAAVTNIALDYLFVIRMGHGIAGAAWATGIAQVLSTAILLVHFLSRRTQFRLGIGTRFRFKAAHLVRAVRLGAGDSITEFSVGIVIFIFNNRILQVIGEAGVVSYTIVAYVTTLVMMTMIGITQGMQPLVSYYHGKRDRAMASYVLRLALVTAGICSVLWFVAAELGTGLFVSLFIKASEEAALFADTIRAFRIYAISYLFAGVNIVLATYFSAIEKPAHGIALALARGLIVIAASLFGMSRLLGASGIWLSPTVSELVCIGIGLFSLQIVHGKGVEHIFAGFNNVADEQR